MFEDLSVMAKTYVGLVGAAIAAMFGIMTRHVYAPDGFKWKAALFDTPFAAFCAILAGGIGQYFNLPDLIIYAIAGSIGYMSPHFLSAMIRRIADKKLPPTDGGQ